MITIPQGNSFDMLFPLVQHNSDGTNTAINANTLTGISTTIIQNGVNYSVQHQVWQQTLMISMPGTLGIGRCSVIIKAKIGERNIQSNIRNAFEICEWNEESTWQNHIVTTYTAEVAMLVPAPSPQDEIIAEFPTDDMNGKGGFDGIVNGNTTAIQQAELNWTAEHEETNVYEANQCLKIGCASMKGVLQISGIEVTQDAYMLKFKGIRWGGANGKLNCTVSVQEDFELKHTSLTAITGDIIQQYGFYLDFREVYQNQSQTIDLTIRFENATTGDRCFIGDIQLIRLANE